MDALKVKPDVKTTLSPGSRVVTDYLRQAGLDKPLEQLGFHTAGYGCMTCIGNSGPLPEPVTKAVGEGKLIAAAVLSGNRNFEGAPPAGEGQLPCQSSAGRGLCLGGHGGCRFDVASRWAPAATAAPFT